MVPPFSVKALVLQSQCRSRESCTALQCSDHTPQLEDYTENNSSSWPSDRMADSEVESQSPEPMAEEEPLFTTLDIFLFTLIAGLLIYWFMSRQKKEEIPEFKKLTTVIGLISGAARYTTTEQTCKAAPLSLPSKREMEASWLFLLPDVGKAVEQPAAQQQAAACQGPEDSDGRLCLLILWRGWGGGAARLKFSLWSTEELTGFRFVLPAFAVVKRERALPLLLDLSPPHHHPPLTSSLWIKQVARFVGRSLRDTAAANHGMCLFCAQRELARQNRNIVVFYGSQTGTAEEFSNRLAKDAQRYGMRGMAADPEEYDMSELSRLTEIENSLAVFCMATYGEGDPTDNAQDFYDWLQETDAELEGVNFSVFALGNKTYEHYNAMGKYVDKRLVELGASRIFDLGLGDDDANLEEDFVSWREQFWPAVCEHFGVEATGEDSSIRQYELVVHNDINMNKVYTGEMGRLKSFETQKPKPGLHLVPADIMTNPFLAPVVANRKLNKGGSRHLMHIELDISGSKIRYDSGDHIAVYPINDVAIVNRIGEILGVDLDTVISLNNLDEESNKKHPFPCPTTYRTALMHYLDVTSPPRTNVLYELAQYATDPKDQENMRKMASSSAEGKALYQSWVLDSRRNILAILEDLSSLRPPIDHLCELMPRLQARYYSIASSAKVRRPQWPPILIPSTPNLDLGSSTVHANTVHICAVVVEYETKAGRVNKGVATNWLKNKLVTDNGHKSSVPMYVRKSQFRLPFKASNPVIMIGPGTGIAPFMGFIQERGWLKEQGKEVGETVLYYGCRHRNEDYLYQEELEEFERAGVLTQLNVAFSRDQAQKVYVQHLLKQNKDHLWKLIHTENAHIYICGDARNMARDVQTAFYEIGEEVGGLTRTQAVDYIKKLMTKGRYSQDVWS
ncbi:hypothetical protein JZ751_023166 [Albula glossodonta]|uniref:NADPH--cytochrome P450 reductase n=1 Tax=Albula glossodonta TaxID=121402 RepID=A0A8T2PHA3_9TELE|nr:hypothetical protein JZ751_023166 [Albula glossodonta]